MSDSEALLRTLTRVVAEASALLGRFEDPRGGRPATSQERRRLADEAGRVVADLDALCGDIGAWMASARCEELGGDRNNGTEKADASAPANRSDDVCAEVTEAQGALDRARSHLQGSVEAARADGATWRQIGESLGITAQTAHKRFDPEARRRHATYMRDRNQRLNASRDDVEPPPWRGAAP